jgi:chromosome segregation ATPase
MNLFSFGNLLSIVIVLVILIIYRQLDRNNRSLEKLKRFSDKIRDGLTGLVDEKTAEMKNLAIELQVNLKTGKEVLKRVREAEDGLQQRSEAVQLIQSRIEGYDQALEELVTMTARVDENLKRIHSESLFVDKVGKRVAGAAQRLQKVEQDIGQVDQRFREENQRGLAALRDEVLQSMEARVQGVCATVEESEKKVKDFGVYLTRVEARGEQLSQETLAGLQKSLEEFELEAKSRRAALLGQFVASMNKVLADADLKGKQLRQGYATSLKLAEQKLSDQQGRLEEAAKKGEALEGKAFDGIRAMIAGDLAELTTQREELRKKIEQSKSFGEQVAEHMRTLDKELERLKTESLQQVAKAAETVQVSALAAVEQRLEGHEKQVAYRFQKLEAAKLDIEAMDKNLHGLIGKSSSKIRDELEQFGRKLAEERRSERESVQGEFERLKAGTQELEHGLTELKAKAYENVSAQLQVFEDDFFKDLRARSEAMDGRLQEWQGQVEARIQEVLTKQVGLRATLEARFTEELKNELEKVKQDSFQGFQRLEERVSAFTDAVAERVSTADEQVQSLRASLTQALERIGREAEEGYKGEMASWQARLGQVMQEHEAGLTERVLGLRQQSEALVASVRQEFTAQKEQLVAAGAAETTQMRERFNAIGERIDALELKLSERSEAALESFQRQAEALQSSLNQRTKDLQSEWDNRTRELKSRLTDTKEKTDALRQGLFAKIDEGYKLLSGSLNDMDKRVKGFAAQTRLFERADELKTQLESWIAEMRRDMEKLQGQRKESGELDQRLSGMKKTAEEVGGRLAKLLAERGRVEDLDSEFKKLLSVSRDLDQRIESVQTTQDALQEIQAKIRQLEELEKTTEGRFDRLEKKKAILEETTAAVDKNFEQLGGLEKALSAVDAELRSASEQLAELKGQADVLAANKEKSDSVVEKLHEVDGLLADLEGRMKKLEKAREWLAKTETRFETIGKQAQEQVRLLESILKADKKQSRLGEGAPAMDKRETVIKLAHLGWSPAEIARTTKLSRGEVELILELAPKK